MLSTENIYKVVYEYTSGQVEDIDDLLKKWEPIAKNSHYRRGSIGGTDYFTLTSLLYDAIHNERVATETCAGRMWRARHQKCSCCRRNRSMRDLWEKVAVDGNV